MNQSSKKSLKLGGVQAECLNFSTLFQAASASTFGLFQEKGPSACASQVGTSFRFQGECRFFRVRK